MNSVGAFLSSEAGLRFAVAAGVLAAMILAEALRPARPRIFSRFARWPVNIALTLANTAMLRLIFPVLAVGVAIWAEQRHFGLLPWLGIQSWAAFAAALLVLDVVIYGQHLAMHRFAVLWRLHRVHHSDRDVDVTTAVRFHPGEIALSMGLKMAVVALLGAPPASVLALEAILNGMASFNHANLRLPLWLERGLRTILVTPDMHRIHHSTARADADSNYGFNLSLWDRLFRTYRSAAGRPDFALGLEGFQTAEPNRLLFALMLPFRREPAR